MAQRYGQTHKLSENCGTKFPKFRIFDLSLSSTTDDRIDSQLGMVQLYVYSFTSNSTSGLIHHSAARHASNRVRCFYVIWRFLIGCSATEVLLLSITGFYVYLTLARTAIAIQKHHSACQ